MNNLFVLTIKVRAYYVEDGTETKTVGLFRNENAATRFGKQEIEKYEALKKKRNEISSYYGDKEYNKMLNQLTASEERNIFGFERIMGGGDVSFIVEEVSIIESEDDFPLDL